MTTKKRKSRILQEVRETARVLHKIGLIDDRRMAEFDALCHPNGRTRLETRYRGLADEERK